MKESDEKKNYKESDGSGTSILNALAAEASTTDGSWEDLGALINVLKTYGCIEARNETVDNLDVDNQVYDVTVAGENVGMLLGFENSFWCIVAFGGAWDVLERLRLLINSVLKRITSRTLMYPTSSEGWCRIHHK